MDFVEEIPGRTRDDANWGELLAEVEKHPNQWGIVAKCETRDEANLVRARLTATLFRKKYASGRFTTAVRHRKVDDVEVSTVYCKWIPTLEVEGSK